MKILIAAHKTAADWLRESDYGKFKISCEELIEERLGKNGIIPSSCVFRKYTE